MMTRDPLMFASRNLSAHGPHDQSTYPPSRQKIAAQSAYLLKEVTLVLRGQRAQDAQPQLRAHLQSTTRIVSTRGTHVMLLTVRG